MSHTIASDLASLCWTNPFREERAELERRLTGERLQPIRQADGVHAFSRNLPKIIELCEGVLSSSRRPNEYEEVVAFLVYHQLVPEFDAFILKPGNARPLWRKFARLWKVYLPDDDKASGRYDPATLFALFYQIRRAFYWIFNYVIGSSEEALTLRARIWESIFSADLRRYVAGFHEEMNDMHTLITGPSGSGKGVIARAIGMSRFIPFNVEKEAFAAEPGTSFKAVNVATLPLQLLESELFGHAKGAFTGASCDHAGLFESVGQYGVLFLDEIGEAEYSAQAKLLTVLQERTYQRLGETRARVAKGRVVTATNRHLESAVANGSFREDLYFRLSADRLETVSLEKLVNGRVADLKPMVEHITRGLLRSAWSPVIVDDALSFIENRLGAAYSWPGNFRELEQCLRNFLVHRDYQPVRFGSDPTDKLLESLRDLELSAEELLQVYAATLHSRLGSYKAVGEWMGVDQRTAKRYCRKGK